MTKKRAFARKPLSQRMIERKQEPCEGCGTRITTRLNGGRVDRVIRCPSCTGEGVGVFTATAPNGSQLVLVMDKGPTGQAAVSDISALPVVLAALTPAAPSA